MAVEHVCDKELRELRDRALDYARQLAHLRAENQRLRLALEEVVSWSSRKAANHGGIGVREFALQVLDNDGPVNQGLQARAYQGKQPRIAQSDGGREAE